MISLTETFSLLQVAHSFLTALQSDERPNYQLDVKFQESYLSKVVSLLQCKLTEGAVAESNARVVDMDICKTLDSNMPDEIEEGELLDSYGEKLWISLVP